MRCNIHSLILILFTFLLFSCEQDNTTLVTESEDRPDRNMFGLYIPRGLTLNSDKAEEGYVMFCVPNSASTYLINRKGEVVHEWKGNYQVMGAYLQDDGSLFQNVHDPDFPVFNGGGQTGRLQKIAWNSKILWDYESSDENYHTHHDFHVMPNGNILSIAWEAKTKEEAIALGRKEENIPEAGLWPDKIIEIRPTDQYHGEVVWEWHSWDHIVQNTDPNKPNYGNPVDHPELIDINLGRELPPPISVDSMDRLQEMGRARRNQTAFNRGSDLYHFNAINYNPDLDQIVFSSPALDEIMIIDHSTTSKEAASHKGGRMGKGGDILYRWGNPQNYGRGDSTDQKLFGQHDIKWIEKNLPGAGHLTVFNNDIPNGPDSMDYSAVYELIPAMDDKGNYIIEANQSYRPNGPVWSYIAPDTVSLYSSFISGAHRMPSGNTFIHEGAKARMFEVTPEGKIVWEYLNPYRGEIRKLNGDPKDPNNQPYSAFRSTFIPADHPALVGKELNPIDPQPTPFKLPPKDAENK